MPTIGIEPMILSLRVTRLTTWINVSGGDLMKAKLELLTGPSGLCWEELE
jgi:hypothetical protein